MMFKSQEVEKRKVAELSQAKQLEIGLKTDTDKSISIIQPEPVVIV